MSSLFLLSPVNAVLAELQQADLITSGECEALSDIIVWDDICGVVRVQRDKSPEVVFQTADVLRRHGFKETSRLLAGRQLLIHLSVLCCMLLVWCVVSELCLLTVLCGHPCVSCVLRYVCT